MASKKFSLIRVDSDCSKKTDLKTGVHIFGRGSLLDVDDKRISRKHGQLDVTNDSLTVTALHPNPCFYKRNLSSDVQVLRQDDSISLNHGDRLGLLSGSYWFEVLHLPLDSENNTPGVTCNEENKGEINLSQAVTQVLQHSTFNNDTDKTASPCSEDTETQINLSQAVTQVMSSNIIDVNKSVSTESLNDKRTEESLERENDDNEHIQKGESERTIDDNKVTEEKDIQDDISMANDLDETNFEDATSPSVLSQNEMEQDGQSNEVPPPSEGSSPLKRPHDSDEGSSDAAKKIKEESDVKPEIKTEPAPGSSTSSDAKNPPPLPLVLRERCMYGSSCYRRNPAHLSQYSHPRDADWGDGERAPCPRGAACTKRDPRHWRDHDHPPGVSQPPPQPQPLPGQRVVHRNGNIFYINAHTVNFYDDHFETEDSDGNSVDYDYEFD